MQSQTPLEEFYQNDAYLGFAGNFSPDTYSEYVEFVKENIGEREVYEIGSGLGAAAYSLHSQGVRITATDIFPQMSKKKFQEIGASIPVIQLNAVKNHLPNNSVENYSLFQVFEHIEDSAECLRQCHRSLVVGGKIIIVSPNLISPLSSAQSFVFGLTKKWKTPYFYRADGYSFPLGSTVLGAFGVLLKNICLSIVLSFFPGQRRPRYRIPCLKKPALSDSDAVFLTEPLTIKRMLETIGFRIVSFQQKRRAGRFAGSVWIVAEKTEQSSP